MKRKLLKLAAFTIAIGILALAFNTAFGSETVTFLEKVQIKKYYAEFYIYKFDFWTYIRNLSLSTSDLSILTFIMPTRAWQTEINLTNWFEVIGNNLAVILDYVIMIINILLYPLKVGAYLIRNVLAIIGVNTDITNENNGLAWLVYFINNILANISIPYI